MAVDSTFHHMCVQCISKKRGKMLDRREFLLGSIGAGIAAFGGEHSAASVTDPISELLKKTVGSGEKVSGMIAINVDEKGTRMASFGSSGVPGLALDRDTVFEIGSITKVFTALMLVDMASRGEVALNDPVTKYLPANVHLHKVGRPITLLDLATYTSGLPKLPTNMPPNLWAKPDPFADYTEEKLYEFLSSYVPEYESGAHYDYSNAGFALLGMTLARRIGKSYEQLLIERVCNPLGLSNTRITLSADMRRHLAQAHDIKLNPTPLWNMQALQPAGAFRANVKDVTLFLKSAMGLIQTPLKSSLARMLETRRHTGLTGTDVGLGWFISSDESEEIVWKTGLTGGFNTFIGFSSRNRRGALVFSNFLWAPIDVGTTNIGMKLINPDFHPADLAPLYR
jgi:serine-type D-Ala-D-Ala carboxypeptidase/endopeptidase